MKWSCIMCLMLAVMPFLGAENLPELFDMAQGNETRIAVSVGQEFVLRIRGQISTGYSWRVSKESESLPIRVLDVTQQEPPAGEKLLGSFEYELWRCKAEKCGEYRLELQYLRPWEKREAPAKIHTFIITVS